MQITYLKMVPPNFALGETVSVTITYKMGTNESLSGPVSETSYNDANLSLIACASKASGAATDELALVSDSETAMAAMTAKLDAGKSRTVTIPMHAVDNPAGFDDAPPLSGFLVAQSIDCAVYRVKLDLVQWITVLGTGHSTAYHMTDDTANYYGNLMPTRTAPVIPQAIADANGMPAMYGGHWLTGESRIVLAAPVLDARDPTLTCSGTLTIGGTLLSGAPGGPQMVGGKAYPYGIDGGDTGPLDLTLDSATQALDWLLTCTDSAGQRSTASGTITVDRYTAPSISGVTSERYKGVSDDYGTTHYLQADDGTQVRFDLLVAVSPVNGLNAWTLKLSYRLSGSADALTAGTPATARSGTDGCTITAAEITDATAGALLTSALSATAGYDIVLTLSDRLHSVQAVTSVYKAGGYANIERYGTAIGMRSTGTQAAPKLESAYPVYPYAGIRPVAAAPIEIPLTLTSKFTRYWDDSGAPTLRVYGNIAMLSGIVKPTASISGSATLYPILYIPEGYRPADYVHALCQGTSQCYWLLGVNADGEVDFSRYRNTNAWVTASTSVFLPFHVVWIIP